MNIINNKLLKIVTLILLSMNLFSTNAFANEVGLFIPGISYHIGANDARPAYSEAPLGLDKNGAFVINPGIGIVYANRDQEKGSSFSWSAMGIAFKDCDYRGAFAVGVGGNYRHYLSKRFSLQADLYLSLYIAQNWYYEKYHTSFMPFPSIGINYHFDKVFNLKGITFGTKTTWSPRNKSHSSTSGFHLLFTYFYIGYSFINK